MAAANMSNSTKNDHISNLMHDPRVKVLDSAEINKILHSLPPEIISKVIKRRNPKPSRKRETLRPPRRIPQNLVNAIDSLKLLDEPSYDARVNLFLGYCSALKNYSYNTVLRYFTILKENDVFGDSVLMPSKLGFMDLGKRHTRTVSVKDFVTFARKLHNHISLYTMPIILALYTGLRSMEILNMSTFVLYQLSNRTPVVKLKRKQTNVKPGSDPVYWEPVYTANFAIIINLMLEMFSKECRELDRYNIDVKLFNVTPKTLANRIRTLYYTYLGRLPPHGFGIHSCRNMVAIIMNGDSEHNNKVAIQTFLQHKSLKTTIAYIKADFSHVVAEFDRITMKAFPDLIKNLLPETQ